MTETDEPIDEIKRERPSSSKLKAKADELLEAWQLYGVWKQQQHQLNGAETHLSHKRPDRAASLQAFFGNLPEFEAAGITMRNTIEARLNELANHDLIAATERGELTTDELEQIEQITLQWQREAQLTKHKPSPERDHERGR